MEFWEYWPLLMKATYILFRTLLDSTISLVQLSAHYGHNCQILSKYYHDSLLQKTKNIIQPGPINVLGPKYVKNIASRSLKKYTKWDKLSHIFRALYTIDPNFFDLDG